MEDLFQCGMSLYNLEMGGVMENDISLEMNNSNIAMKI